MFAQLQEIIDQLLWSTDLKKLNKLHLIGWNSLKKE